MKSFDAEMEAIKIPCVPSEEIEDPYETLEILYKLSSALGGLVYGPPKNLPISIFVLTELATMDPPDFLPECRNLFDAVKEAAFALSDKNTAIQERKREELIQLFTDEEKNELLEEKSRIIQIIGIHRETLRKIHQVEQTYFSMCPNSTTTPPASNELSSFIGQDLMTTRCTLQQSEERFRAKLTELATRLKERLIISTESKIKKILMTLRNVTSLIEKHIIKVDPSILSRRLYEITSWTYKTPVVNVDEFLPLVSPRLARGIYKAIRRRAEMNSVTNKGPPITYEHINVYVKSSESLYVQNGSERSCRRARRIKQKLVSIDAKKAFGWTRFNLLTPKRWVLYSMSSVQKIY
ncbi:hypothetical protein CHS0354_032154 [Potamilus streckersoni]|uniref:Uncharacterized protein n=1 Tax=Potamilus streckersoni TaxID=2493646 RepID=A0AAE0THH2_9BIVA|nr:hypothetical protein CHS0354_032154 [Potamilus streckersoni]